VTTGSRPSSVAAGSAPNPFHGELYYGMIVHLIDGTYELFRQFYGQRRFT
jgi:hypothetical protein